MQHQCAICGARHGLFFTITLRIHAEGLGCASRQMQVKTQAWHCTSSRIVRASECMKVPSPHEPKPYRVPVLTHLISPKRVADLPFPLQHSATPACFTMPCPGRPKFRGLGFRNQLRSLKLFVGVGSADVSRTLSVAGGGVALGAALTGEGTVVDEGRLQRVSPVFLWL
jgi:hypothetical protein